MLIGVASLFVGLMSVGQVEPLPHVDSLTDGLRGPARLSVHRDAANLDTIFVTDPLSQRVTLFEPDGDVLGTLPVSEGPIGVAVHPDGRIFVSLRDIPKVAIYDDALSFVEYLGESDPLVSFAGPTDIEIAPDSGRVYVVDPLGDRVYGFESDGTLALILGTRGSWPGEFIYPSAIAVDEPRHRLIIADHDKSRLQVFTMGGVFLQQFGDRLTSTDHGLEGWMPRPLGLAVDAWGQIYVTDALMGTVRVFDETGTELGKIVTYGYDPGGLRVPCDLAISPDGARLYVVSTNSSRVEVYDLTDTARAEPGTTSVEAADIQSPSRAELPDLPLNLAAEVKTRETSWDGPHIVEDRPDICGPCHGITGQPGAHGGTVEGQANLCMSCHTSGGRALGVALYERDMADPFGTNPHAADGKGRSHAWGVPAVNPLTDSIGPRQGGVMASYLDRDGNIKCATCHNQHNTYHGPSYLRVSNDGDAMCKQCHAPRDRGVGEGGSHPVGSIYPAGEDEYPTVGEIGPLLLEDSKIECMSCHAPHGADSGGANDGDGDGMLLRTVNDETLCQLCHTEHIIHDVTGEWRPTCPECHDIHDSESENLKLIAREIDGASVSYVDPEIACADQGDFIHAVCDPPTYDGVCEVCHTDTDYHRNNPELDHTHSTHAMCTDCHPHSLGFLPSCLACHGDPPDGAETPNRAGAHAMHLTGVNGPKIDDCDTCHTSSDKPSHDDGVVGFASGVDANLDGNTDLSETDACDTCHSPDGPFDGVEDPIIGAKPNWLDGVYDGDVLKPERADWCLGCHDTPGAEVDDVPAPSVAGDNESWGYKLEGHGLNLVLCTDCHDPTMPHIDGEPNTFGLEFPLGLRPPEERPAIREAYNTGYRLRLIGGGQALAVPRDEGDYTSDDFRLCLECHDELKLLGVPSNYGWQFTGPPPELMLPEGVAQTNYRNELEWGYSWHENGERPANPHWNHLGWTGPNWNIDHDNFVWDSRLQCVTCHDPHGVQAGDDGPTPAMTRADLAITTGVYTEATTDYDYGYIGSGDYLEPGGDLHCWPCHFWSGRGADPPDHLTGQQTRYYREPLDLPKRTCVMCHNLGADDEGEQLRIEPVTPITSDDLPWSRATACSTAHDGLTDADCLVCHDVSRHRQGIPLLSHPNANRISGSRVWIRGEK